MDRITDFGMDFKDFEQWCFDLGLAFARMLMKDTLKALDDELLLRRDKGAYRAKGTRPLTIRTLMGEVEIRRRTYRTVDAEGNARHVFLLDEEICLDTVGKFTMGLVSLISETVTECSYRETGARVSEMTGQAVSHGGVWGAVQKAGAAIRAEDSLHAAQWKAGEACGGREAKVLQEEFDGVWVNMQGKDRPEKGRKAEMKMSLCYEGVRVRYAGKGKTDNDLVNPVYFAGFEAADRFYELKEGLLASKYNLDEVEVRLANGDGGGWVRGISAKGCDETHLQLDPFHVKREICRSGLPKEQQARIGEMIVRGEIAQMLELAGALAEGEADEAKKKSIAHMHGYFTRNRDFLTPIKDRGLSLPEPPEGTAYGSMGAMEGAVGSCAALRMKRHRASFTKEGASNLARLICLKRSGELRGAVLGLSGMRLPMPLEQAVTHILSAAKAPKTDGRGDEYPVRGGMPFADVALTNGRKSIQRMAGRATWAM